MRLKMYTHDGAIEAIPKVREVMKTQCDNVEMVALGKLVMLECGEKDTEKRFTVVAKCPGHESMMLVENPIPGEEGDIVITTLTDMENKVKRYLKKRESIN